MYNELWALFAFILAVLGVAFRQVALAIAPLLFLVVYGIGRLWERNAFRGVIYRRSFSPRRAFVDETIEFTLELDNRKLLPLSWLCVSDTLPEGLSFADETDTVKDTLNSTALYEVFALRWYERLRKRYRILCHRRGYYRFGAAHFVSGDVFGFFKVEARHILPDWLIVYPRVYPIESFGLPSNDPFGDFKSPQVLFEDPLRTIGVRDYQPGDGFRRVHWKATARRQRLQSRVYEPATSHKLVLFLNIATFAQPWRGTIPDVLERLISITASLANYAIEHRYSVGVLANSSVPNSSHHIKVPPGRSPQQITRILEALAAVTPVAPTSIENLLTEESPKLARGATLVVVTAVVTDPLAATLLHLSRAGRKIVLITLADALPSRLLYQHVLAYHLPADRLAFVGMAPPEPEGADR
jgi:uncharacterized repeat protein (TIGR01451 family)